MSDPQKVPTEKEQALDELSSSQIARLWRDGCVTSSEALNSLTREGCLDEIMMAIIANHLLGKLS